MKAAESGSGISKPLFLAASLPRWFALCCGGAGAGKESAAGADPEPGGALPGPGGAAAASGSHRGVTGNLAGLTWGSLGEAASTQSAS